MKDCTVSKSKLEIYSTQFQGKNLFTNQLFVSCFPYPLHFALLFLLFANRFCKDISFKYSLVD